MRIDAKEKEGEFDHTEFEDKITKGESQKEFSWMKNQNQTKDVFSKAFVAL